MLVDFCLFRLLRTHFDSIIGSMKRRSGRHPSIRISLEDYRIHFETEKQKQIFSRFSSDVIITQESFEDDEGAAYRA